MTDQNSAPEYAIEVDNLQKVYAASGRMPEKHALKGISLKIPRGSIFGLLGPNGAGKSTFINILAGLVNKTSGTARIWGLDIDKHPRQSRAAIGVVNQEIVADPFFTPFEMLELMAGFYGVPKADRQTDEILVAVGLDDKKDAYVRQLSGGMKRRLMVAKALVHNPPVLILDEPTAGVDVELRRSMWDFMQDLNKAGTTIILTTHYLEEAEQLCRNIAIINHGEIIQSTSVRELLGQLNTETFILDLTRPVSDIPEFDGFSVRQVTADSLEAEVTKGQSLNGLFAELDSRGIEVRSMRTKSNRLEEMFVGLVREDNA